MANKITYKINRLSNPDLQLGLKTGATLTGSTSNITSTKLLQYTSAPKFTNDLDIVDKAYVDSSVAGKYDDVIAILGSYVSAGDRISVSKSNDNGTPSVSIGLSTVYTDGKTFADTDTKTVISGITVDKYGTITNVTYKQISTADLNNSGTYDNYKNWQVKVGTTTFDVASSNIPKDSTDPIVPLTFSADAGLAISMTTTSGPLIKYSLDLLSDGPIITNSDNKVTLRTLIANGLSSGLYKIAVDKYGRVTAGTAATATDITALVNSFNATQAGIVSPKSTDNTATASTGSFFLTENGKWAQIPYDKIAIATDTNSTTYLIGTTATSGSTTGLVNTNVSINGSGQITAAGFSGNGANLSSLDASKITTGTLSADRLPTIPSSKGGVGTLSTPGSVLYTSTKDGRNVITELANPVVNQTKDTNYVLTKSIAKGAVNTISPAWVDIDTLVTNIVTNTGGMVFVGIVSDPSEIDDLRVFHKGCFYKVGTAGTYAGHNCEVGDTIYATKDYDKDYSATTKGEYWAVLQGNIERNISLAPAASKITEGIVPVKVVGGYEIYDTSLIATSDASGSNWSLATDISGNAATTTKLKSAVTLWGQSFDGSGNISGNLSGVGNIIPSTNNTSSLGTSDKKFKTIYATEFNGNATSASQVNHSLTITANGTEVTYNGSSDQAIEITAAGLGALTGVTIGTATGSGNVISSLTPTVNGQVVTITPNLKTVVESVESSVFNFSTSGTSKATLSFLSDKPSTLAFYTSGSANIPDGTSNLYLNGGLVARDLFIVDRADKKTTVQVAQTQTGKASSINGSSILVKKTISGSTYEFIDSGATISTTLDTSDNKVPTSNAVQTAISNAVAVSACEMKCLKLAVGTATVSSSASIPSCVVDHVDVAVKNVYAESATLAVSIGNTTIITTNETDLHETGVYSFKLSDDSLTGKLTATLANATQGSLVIYVYYVTSPLV